ncbi:MAG: DUF4407 domain-containing protein [Verrucomicrobiales bacterium]|jgi:hypothetical protein|nr:DUF4407 domain-containing protein [Verrucomicrobiales bacterium]
MSEPNKFQRFIRRTFFWLSGASTDALEKCPEWEQRKYVAFGATVLVPTAFAILASSYAMATLTSDPRVIVPVALVWGFIILTIDRALLATYRSYQPFLRKLSQFALRVVVAVLMGLTISHPLTLLLFKDTVSSVIETEREAEIVSVRGEFSINKAEVEAKLKEVEGQIEALRVRRDQTYEANFIVEDEAGGTGVADGLDAEAREALRKKVDAATSGQVARIAAVGKESEALQATYQKLQGELDFWQREFEREVNGQRSGIVGLGPRAKSIRADQLEWRRAETSRISGQLKALTIEVGQLRGMVASVEETVTGEFLAAASVKAQAEKIEKERVAALKHKVQERQIDLFVEQQKAVREGIDEQVAARTEELKRLQGELAGLAADERTRIDAINAEPRRDILTQTLALHSLFGAGESGGRFALMAYAILAGLFMLVDTIPLIVKFFTKPGPYDSLVDCDEVRFDKEREAFLNSYDTYMEGLEDGGLLLASKNNKPLENALIEGVDRSRAAKEFLENLMELEHSFEERMTAERLRLAEKGVEGGKHSVMLDEMAETFYDDLRGRMESFFASGGEPDGLRA